MVLYFNTDVCYMQQLQMGYYILYSIMYVHIAYIYILYIYRKTVTKKMFMADFMRSDWYEPINKTGVEKGFYALVLMFSFYYIHRAYMWNDQQMREKKCVKQNRTRNHVNGILLPNIYRYMEAEAHGNVVRCYYFVL